MKRIALIYPVLLIIGLCGFTAFVVAANDQEDSLYSRVGGYDVIAKFSVELIDRFNQEPSFKRFTEGGGSVEQDRRDKQLTTEYLCKITGGPCFYIGKDMRSSHQHWKITPSEWTVFMEDVAELVDDWKIKSADKKEFLNVVDNIKNLVDIHNP